MDVNQELNKQITDYYARSPFEENFGDHLHHGYYDINDKKNDLRAAEIRIIEEALRVANIPEEPLKKPKTIIDVGCGLGGTAFQLAKKYGANCVGINLSPHHVQKATEMSIAQGIGHQVTFQVADANQLPFPNGQFDLVWSMECAEFVATKSKFVSEMVRVAAPGGTIILTCLGHRELAPNEETLKPEEKEVLEKIGAEALQWGIVLPEWVSISHYVDLFKSHFIKDLQSVDWSEHVAPSYNDFRTLCTTTKRDVPCSLEQYIEGYKRGIIKYGIVTCQKL